MRIRSSVLVFVALLAWSVPAGAQTAADPSGHWEGTITLPTGAMPIEVDIAKSDKGLSGTFGQPAQGIKGLPLENIKVDGKTVTFLLKAGTDANFSGTLADDGKTITGQVAQMGTNLPFTLTRTGDAKVAEAPKNAPIAKEFEGTWNGTLDVGGRQITLTLKMANQADGTSGGTIQAVEGGPMAFPIGLKQKDKELTVEVPTISGTFVGTLNAEGTEMTGTWTQRGAAVPLVFKKAPK